MTIRTTACLALVLLTSAGCQVLRSAVHGRGGDPTASTPAGESSQGSQVLRGKLSHHLRYHQSFPAGREEILTGLASSTELTDWERGEVGRRLGRYPLPFSRPTEVLAIAGLGKPCAPTVQSAPVCSR